MTRVFAYFANLVRTMVKPHRFQVLRILIDGGARVLANELNLLNCGFILFLQILKFKLLVQKDFVRLLGG